MTKRIIAPLAVGLLCVYSMGASAALSPKYSDRVRHHLHFTHQNFAAMQAAVPETPTIFPSARPQPYPYNFHETDGLSRNPNDCVVWGCIDSN
jgi:hypothetical protein